MKMSFLLRKQTMLLKAVVVLCSWRETCKTRFTGQRETGKFEQEKHEQLTCCLRGDREYSLIREILDTENNALHKLRSPGNDY